MSVRQNDLTISAYICEQADVVDVVCESRHIQILHSERIMRRAQAGDTSFTVG